MKEQEAEHKVRITLAVVKALQPGDVVHDSELKGFGVRRQSKCASYFIRKRVKGRLKRITIGRHGSPWTPETARKQAASLMQDIAVGVDPIAKRRAERSKETTFNTIADHFLKVHGSSIKPTTYDTYEAVIRIQLKPWFGKMAMVAIERGDVAKFHAAWSHRSRTANHSLAVLSKMFAWAMETGHLPKRDNPCHGQKRYKETKRQRYLGTAELRAIGEAMSALEAEGKLNIYVAAAIQLLMLTGARLREILTLKWEYVDLERRRLFLPDSKTGSKAITLNSSAVELLERLPRLEKNPYVLPGQRTAQHLVNLRLPWLDICAKAGVKNVRIHDLRHSFASMAVTSGGSLPVIGKLLGHSQSQTTARYAHVADNPMDELAETTGQAIAAALGFGYPKAGETTQAPPESVSDVRPAVSSSLEAKTQEKASWAVLADE